MMNMSRFLCVGVSAAALLYCGDVWASEIYGTSVPEGYQAYNLNESGLNAGMLLSLPQKGAKQVASVCFITDAGNCGGAGGGIDSSSSSSGPGPIDPDGSNMCKLEGYAVGIQVANAPLNTTKLVKGLMNKVKGQLVTANIKNVVKSVPDTIIHQATFQPDTLKQLVAQVVREQNIKLNATLIHQILELM